MGPQRDDHRYRVFCPSCQRHGVFAGWRNLLTGERVSPDEFTCPDCNVRVEVLGREDQ